MLATVPIISEIIRIIIASYTIILHNCFFVLPKELNTAKCFSLSTIEMLNILYIIILLVITIILIKKITKTINKGEELKDVLNRRIGKSRRRIQSYKT